MLRFAALFAVLFLSICFPAVAAASDEDPTFGAGGTADIPGLFLPSEWNEIVVLSDDSVATAFFSRPTFGNYALNLVITSPDGVITAEMRDWFADMPVISGAGMARDSQDRVVVALWGYSNPSTHLTIARFLPNGALDPTFGAGGYTQRTGLAGSAAQFLGEDVAVGPSDAVYVLGQDNVGRGLVRKFDSNGADDNAFGLGGTAVVVTPAPGVATSVTKLVITADGSSFLAGSIDPTGAVSRSVVVAQLSPSGVRNSSFGTTGDGFAHVPHDSSAPEGLRDILLLTDGRLAVGGSRGTSGFVSVFHQTGNLDTGFGTGGVSVAANEFYSIAERRGVLYGVSGGGSFSVTAFGAQAGTPRRVFVGGASATPAITGGQRAVAVQSTGKPVYVQKSSSTSMSLVRLAPDLIPPAVTLTSPVDGAVFTSGQAVVATYSCADSGVGMTSCVGSRPNGGVVDTNVAGMYQFVVTGTDVGGNETKVSHAYTVLPADTTRPEITIVSPSEGATFRVGQDVVADFSCSDDGGSGLVSCVGTTARGELISTSVPGVQFFNVTALDGAGNTRTTTHAYTVVADVLAPTVSLSMPSDGAEYLIGSLVVATFSCAEEAGGSGLVSCTGTVPNGTVIDTSVPGTYSVTVTAMDVAGNSTTLTHSYIVHADRTAPIISLSTPGASAAFAVGEHVVAAYSCSDEPGGSGLASCTGTAVTSAVIDTSVAGVFLFTVDAIDNSGNAVSTTHSYSVVAPPETTISPSLPGTYLLSSNVAGSTFECRIDGGSWFGCPSTFNLGVLTIGARTIEARAVSPQGISDPTPAERRINPGQCFALHWRHTLCIRSIHHQSGAAASQAESP
ncbi:MAG: hypothetical protein JWM90_1733 [Thermoleophilia bacterium]|nr:hypothetical protein [Thermoleophilia bacterium]